MCTTEKPEKQKNLIWIKYMNFYENIVIIAACKDILWQSEF